MSELQSATKNKCCSNSTPAWIFEITNDGFKFLVCKDCFDRPEFHMVCETAIVVATGEKIKLEHQK